MTAKQDKILDRLTDEEYLSAKQDGAARLESLCKGEIVVNRHKDYLQSLKKELRKALSHNYTYVDIANVLRDESRGINFTPRQIREFCEENGLTSTKSAPQRKGKGGLNKAVTSATEKTETVADSSEDGTPKKHLNDEDIAEI